MATQAEEGATRTHTTSTESESGATSVQGTGTDATYTVMERLARIERAQQELSFPLLRLQNEIEKNSGTLRELLAELRSESHPNVHESVRARSKSETDEPPDQRGPAERTSSSPGVDRHGHAVVPKVLNLNITDFSGKKEQSLGWLYSVEDKFETAIPSLTDKMKIVQITSHLKDEALVWYTSYRKSAHLPDWCTVYAEFREQFLQAFTDPMESERAQGQFVDLKQGSGSVTDYTTNFNRLRALVGLSHPKHDTDLLMLRQYERGLRQEIIRQLERRVDGVPKNMPELIKAAERIDIQESRIRDLALQRASSSQKSGTSAGTSEKKDSAGSGPKKSGGWYKGSPKFRPNFDKTSNRPSGNESSTNVLVEKRVTRSQTSAAPPPLAEVKCYNCNEKGHYASSCPSPQKKGPAGPRVGAQTSPNIQARSADVHFPDDDDLPYSPPGSGK